MHQRSLYEYDYLLKMAVFGADSVNSLKRDLIIKFSGGKLYDGLDYNVKTINTLNPRLSIKLQLWNALNESLRNSGAPPTYLRGLHSGIIVYDMANPNLPELEKFVVLMKQYYAKSQPLPLTAIVGIQSAAEPKSNDEVKRFAEANGCFFRDNVKLTSSGNMELLFRQIACAQLKNMGVKLSPVNHQDQTALRSNAKRRLLNVWESTTGGTNEKIIALLNDYTGNTTSSIARIFSLFTNWNKHHIQAIARLRDEFQKNKIETLELMTRLENIELEDLNDPLAHIRDFLIEKVMQPECVAANNYGNNC